MNSRFFNRAFKWVSNKIKADGWPPKKLIQWKCLHPDNYEDGELVEPSDRCDGDPCPQFQKSAQCQWAKFTGDQNER